MNKDKIYELFNKLTALTSLEDIGYHKMVDNKLSPVMKSRIGKVTEDDWMQRHFDNPVSIEGDVLISKVVATKRSVYVKDFKEYSNKGMKSFSIHSVYMFPVVLKNEIKGIIAVVSIDKTVMLSEEIISKCEELINSYMEHFTIITSK